MTTKHSLGLLDLPLEFTQSAKVTGNVSTSLLLVRFDEVVDDAVVEVLSSKMCVTSSSQDLEDTVVDRQKRDIECTSSEIVYDDLGFSGLLVETVGNSGGSRLIDDTENLKTSDGTGVLGGLTLSVIEV